MSLLQAVLDGAKVARFIPTVSDSKKEEWTPPPFIERMDPIKEHAALNPS